MSKQNPFINDPSGAPKQSGSFGCPLCNRNDFESGVEWQTHQKVAHYRLGTSHCYHTRCDGQYFGPGGELAQHIQAAHPEDARIATGSNQGLTSQNTLNAHAQDRHLRELRPLEGVSQSEAGPAVSLFQPPPASSRPVFVASLFRSYPQQQLSYIPPPVPSYGQPPTHAHQLAYMPPLVPSYGQQPTQAQPPSDARYGDPSRGGIGELGLPSSARGRPPLPSEREPATPSSQQPNSRDSSQSSAICRQPLPKT